jgi:cysteine-rich repeat protein
MACRKKGKDLASNCVSVRTEEDSRFAEDDLTSKRVERGSYVGLVLAGGLVAAAACMPEPSCSELRTCPVYEGPEDAGAGGIGNGIAPDDGGLGGLAGAATEPPDQEAGAAGDDTGAAGAPTGGSTDPLIGTPCTKDGETRCNEPAGHSILECIDRAWALAEECARRTFCDSRTVECAPIAAGCERLAPGQTFCDGDSQVTCGPDLVTSESTPCEGRCAGGKCQPANCGDGVVQNDEGCDDGNGEDGDDCPSSCEAARCGDGFVHEGIESCDDANADDFDDCPSNCEAARCGDGFTRAGVEECDDGNQTTTDACLPTCVAGRCGDGVIWADQETCEDSNESDSDGCPTTCQIARCGDGFVLSGEEECDDKNQESGDGCSSSCQAQPTTMDLGTSHSCAVLGDGRLKCWGDNQRGQLGLGLTTEALGDTAAEMSANLPAVFDGGVSGVATGSLHTCALKDGALYCWGDNAEGQLGPSSASNLERSPILVPIEDVDFVSAAGDYTAVKLGSGEVAVWGGGSETPRKVAFSDEATLVDCGETRVCALLESHSVECWELGSATTPYRLTLEEHGAGRPALISSGYHTCVLDVEGTSYCFGDNGFGNLVSGDSEDRYGDLPQSSAWPAAKLGQNVASISLGGYITCALYQNQSVKCWGFSYNGVLGQPGLATNDDPLGDELDETGESLPAIRLGTNVNVESIVAGSTHVCALLTDGRIKCWGYNGEVGTLGTGGPPSVGIEASQMGDALPETVVD